MEIAEELIRRTIDIPILAGLDNKVLGHYYEEYELNKTNKTYNSYVYLIKNNDLKPYDEMVYDEIANLYIKQRKNLYKQWLGLAEGKTKIVTFNEGYY